MSSFSSTDITPSPVEYRDPYSFTDRDLQFVGYCLLFGVALLFYLAGSPYFIGWLTKLILKRFVLSKLILDEDCTFDIGTVSIAWLSGTIFAHKIEIRTQQFVLLIVELRLSFFWWTNQVRCNDSFKELMDDNKPYRVQLKLVGVECILYANKSRFDELRKIVESQRLQQIQKQQSFIDQNNNMEAHKSPSIYTVKSSPYSKSKSKENHNKHNCKNNDNKMEEDDDELVDVTLDDDVVETYVVESEHKESTKRESVSMSVNENNHLLMKNRNNSLNKSGNNANENIIIRELKRHIASISPHWFFELCPVTRIGLEKVCVVIGNLNVENYLVGSFKESEMLFYTSSNDNESMATIHQFKYAVIGKMWHSNVRFTKNINLNINVQQKVSKEAQQENKKIAEADYMTDSIYLFDKLLPDHNKKKKIGPLTKESLQINRDENQSPPHQYMLNQYKTMREIHENESVPNTKQDKRSKKEKKKSKQDKKDKKKKKKKKKNKSKKNAKNKKKGKSVKSLNTNPLSEGIDDLNNHRYNTLPTTRPPSTKTGASSVTTNDDNKTFITHSSYYTHSSQRSHQPYTYYYTQNRSHTTQHARHPTNNTNTTHTTDNTVSNSGETGSQTTIDEQTVTEPHPAAAAAATLNVPGTNTAISVKIHSDSHTSINSQQNSPAANDTPVISGFIPRAPSDISQPQIIVEDVGDKGTVTTDQQSSVGTGPWGLRQRTQNSLRPPNTATTVNSSDLYRDPKEEHKYSSDDDEDEDESEEDPDSIEIIHIDSFSFFFQRDSPAQLTNDNVGQIRNIEGLDESILPQQKFEIVVHNECIVNYGPYADDLRAKLMTNFLPFMYQHRELTPLIPTQIGDYFNFSALDIIIKFDEPRFPLNTNAEQYSDSTSSINNDGIKINTDKINIPHFSGNHTQQIDPPPNHDNIPWFIFNIPFSANIPDEAKQLEDQVIDNHLMQIKFGANSLIKISIPWIISDLESKCDCTTIDLSLTPCNISSSIRRTDLYHSIIDTDKFVMKYKWQTPVKWNDLQKHDIDIHLIKMDRISSIYFLSEHINVFRSLSTDWFSYQPAVTIEYFVPSTTSIKLHAKESEIVTSINEFNVIHIHNNKLLNAFISRTSDEFLDNPCNARLKWKGIFDLELSLPSTDWKPSVSNINVVLEMRLAELFLELPAEHPFTDMMPNKKRLSNDDDNNLCLKFRKCKFEMNYIYHLVYYREYRDSMNISIDLTDPEFKIYGHFLRYYWNFIRNYTSGHSEFLTMEEFRNEYSFNNSTALDKRKKLQNITQKINSFEAYTQINIVNASLILPSSIIGSTSNTNYQQKMMNSKNSYTAKIKFEELMFDFRGTDEYTNMYIHSSPIRCMIPLTEQEQASTKSMPSSNNIHTFVSIDSFVLQRQGWNGLPPEYLTYSQAIDGDIGKIKVQLFDCQFQRLIHSINAFVSQYNNSFDSRCFDFREKEHLISNTNDNPDEIDYPSLELSIMNINFDIKSIDISIHHSINMFRYQHITRCICPYGIQIKSSSESTLEFAQKTVINCNKIELQHLISTTKPNAFNSNKDDEKTDPHNLKRETRTHQAQRGRRRSNNGANIRDRNKRNRAQSHHSSRKSTPRNQSRQRGNTATNKRAKNQRKSMKSNKVKDDLLCVGSLDSHFQIILTTERSDQEMYHSKQRNFENRQLQQTEDDVEMDQDWPFHLLNTIYMQEPQPKQRSPNRNTKTMPMYQQTELEYELYGRHDNIRVKQNKKKPSYNADKVIEEEHEPENTQPSVHNLPRNPFDSEDGNFYEDVMDNNDDDSAGTGLQIEDKNMETTADEDTDGYITAEEIKLKSPQPAFNPSIDMDNVNAAPQNTLTTKTSYLTTPSPDASVITQPLKISTDNLDSDNDENYQTLSMKQFHVSNYMAKYQQAGGPKELGSGWKKPRHNFYVNADYVPLPEVSYKITTPSLLRKYMNNSNMMTPRPGMEFGGWGLQVSPRRLNAQQTAENKTNNDDKSTLHITYRTHVNISDNTSIVITPEFLDSVHVYMRMLQPKTQSLSEVLDEMQEFVCDFYHGTYSPHYDAAMDRIRHRQHAPNSRMTENRPAFDQFKQKKIISATIGTIHIQSLERAKSAPGIFLLDARISHISIEHCQSYAGTPWKTVVGGINTTDTVIHFANASFQGFKAAPSVDRSNGMPVEIKEWGHVLDPSLLFETENTEYFVGIEMNDSCLRRTQYMNKEDEVKAAEDDNTVKPAENMIHVQHVKVSTSSTAFSNIATLLHRFGRYTNKISQEIPWQNALKMDRLKLVVGEMLTAVDSLPNLKSQPWHRHFLEWLYLRIKCDKRKHAIKEAICGWDPLLQQSVTQRNNYTRASGMVFMVIVRNLIANLALKVERKLNDGFLNIAQQYIDPQYLHTPNRNTNNYNPRYANTPNARKRYLFAAQKKQFYTRRVDEFGNRKKIADPIIRRCFIELTKECSEMFFPKQNTNHLKYKESIRWNISKTSFEVIQDQEKSYTLYGSQFRGFLKIKSRPPQEFKEENGIYTVTISTTIKKVVSQAKPASLDALFSLNKALSDHTKQSNYHEQYQQQYYNNNMYRFGSFGYESYLIPPSYNTNPSNNIASSHKSSAVFRALRYSKPGHNAEKGAGDNIKYNYYPYYNVGSSNNPQSQQRWVTKIHAHIKFGDIRASIATPECADLDIQIMKLSLVSNRSILPPPVHQSGNINVPPQQHHAHGHSHHSSGSSGSSSFSGFRDEYHHILVNLWKMDARLLLAVELDDISSAGGHSMFSTMSTFDDRQVIFKFSIHESTISVSIIPSFVNDTTNPNFPPRSHSTSEQQNMTNNKTSGTNMGTTKTPNDTTTTNTSTPQAQAHSSNTANASSTTNKTGTKHTKTTTSSSTGSYVEQVSIAIDTEKCVSQILFDRILDSKSNRKRLDIKQLVEPWLNFMQEHIKKNAEASLANNNLTNLDYNEPVEVPPRCVHLIANLDHFKFRSWLSEKCVCIYTLEAITSRVIVKPNADEDEYEYTLSIDAGKKQHQLDFIIYKAPQPSRRMAKDIHIYVHSPHIASINTQKFPFVLTRIITKKESQTAPAHNEPRNEQMFEKYSSFDLGSGADDDELFEKQEKVCVVATIALSTMNAEVSEKMFGNLIRLYSRLRNEATTVIKVYEEITLSVSGIKNNLIRKHSPDTHTVYTKTGYFPQITIQVNIAFEGLDANISLTDAPNIGAIAKSGPINLRIIYNPEYLPVRSDKIALMLNSADHLSLQIWDELNEEDIDHHNAQLFDKEKDFEHDGLHIYDDYDESDIDSSSSGPFTTTTKYSSPNEEEEDADENNSQHLHKTMSGTRIVINDNQLYKAPAKQPKSKKGSKKSSTGNRQKHKIKKSISKSNLNHNPNDEEIREILPLYAKSNIQITAFVQRDVNQWHISQDVNLKETQIQLTPSVVTVLSRLIFKYQEEFKSTITTEVIQGIDDIKRKVHTAVLSRMPTMQNIPSGEEESSTIHPADHELMSTIHDDTEFASHMSYNTNPVTVSKAASILSATSSQKKHNNNIVKPNADQLSVPGVSPTMGATNTAFSFHSGKKAGKGRNKAQMRETEAIEVTHIHLTSMVSVRNFVCVAVLGQNNAYRPILSTSINNRADLLMGNNQCQFISVYCQSAQCGIKSNDLSDTKVMEVSMYVRARNVIAGLDEKINTEKLWKIEKYQHFENLFSNRWRFIEFDMHNELHCKMASIYSIKSNIAVEDVLSIIQPNIVQLMINIADNISESVNDFDVGLLHGTELIGGDKTANNSNEVNQTGPNIRDRSTSQWDIDINFEWRGGKLSLKDNNTVLSLPYIKLFSSIQNAEQQMQSDTFVLIHFDKITLDMHFLQFVGLSIECLNIAVDQRDNNLHIDGENNELHPNHPQQTQRVSNHTLCVSIANLNTTLSCQPIYDKLECVFNVNDPISICWCQSSLELPNRDDAYSDILTISIPKVSMKIAQKHHLMTHVRFDVDIQRSKGYNVRIDGSPLITTLISLEKVVLHTSALGVITTNLFLKCIQKQLSKYSLSTPATKQNARSKHLYDRYPQSPTHKMKQKYRNSNMANIGIAYRILFCIKDKLKIICDLTELPLINTHIKLGLDQVLFEYQDDGRLHKQSTGTDHLIRARLAFRAVIECSERNRSASQYNKHGHKQHPPQAPHSSASSMLGTIMNLANLSHQNEPGSSWKRKLALIKKLEPLQGKFQMNDVMHISFLHHYNPNNPFDTEKVKCGINRLHIKIPQTNILLKTLTLRRIIEVNTTSVMHIEIQDSPFNNKHDHNSSKKSHNNEFAIHIVYELEEGIVLRLAPHSIPYLLSAYYTITEFMKREQNDITAHLQDVSSSTNDGHNDNKSISNPLSSQTMHKNNLSLSESVVNRYYFHRGLSPLSLKSQLSASDFFAVTSYDVTDTPLFVIGSFELKARSVALILYVDNNQKNNYVRLHLNHFRFLFNRECKEYIGDEHTQLIEDDVNVYFGIEDDVKHGLYVVPIQFMLDPNSLKNDAHAGSTKDLIAVPLCHIHYNAKTNIDDFSVTDIFEAKWGNQTFILPLDLRPFDNIGKTFKKYHRDYNEIILKHKKQKNVNVKQQQQQQQKNVEQNNNNNNEEDDESLKTINEKEEQTYQHQKSQTSSSSISSQKSQIQQPQSQSQANIMENKGKLEFTHDKYKFEPPFPSVKYIVSAETILEKLGIKTPQKSIPETFYLSIVEPISASFGVIRGMSLDIDDKLTPLVDDQQ